MNTIEFLQSFSSPLLTNIFMVITSIGSARFYPFAVPILYWTWRKDKAKRLAFILLPSLFISLILKNLFQVERPVGVALADAHGYSFPSGHVLGATVAWGYLTLVIRKRWFTIFAIIIIGLISLSRVYLGVHWPSDVAGAVFFGSLLSTIYFLLEPKITPLVKRTPPLVILLLLFAITIPPAVYYYAITSMGLLMGMVAGALFEERFVGFCERDAVWKLLLRVLIGSAVMLLSFTVYDTIGDSPRIIRYILLALTGFWAFGVAPLLFVMLKLSKKVEYLNIPKTESRCHI